MARTRKRHFRWDDREARRVAREEGLAALVAGAEVILGESQEEVPHATGALMRSGTVTVNSKKGEVYVSYNTPYAVKQHEDLTLRHPDPRNPLSSPGRKAKYLEDPFNRNVKKVLKLARLRVRKALREAR
ncbi:MAG: HK97 gp10 family phage protein [Actinomycetes bacterium]